MRFTAFLDSLLAIRRATGQGSRAEKRRLFELLMSQSNGLAAVFLDIREKKALFVNRKAFLAAQSECCEPLPDTLESVLEINSQIKSLQGPNSRARRIHLLGRILATAPGHRDLLRDYYATGTGRMGWSIKSIAAVRKQPVPGQSPARDPILPMLASTHPIDPSVVYALEAKLDGIRVLLQWNDAGCRATSRAGLSYPSALLTTMKPVLQTLQSMGESGIVDGQLWVRKSKKGQGFQEVSRLVRSKTPVSIPGLEFCAFDVLQLEGSSLKEQPYDQRRSVLERIIPAEGTIRLVPLISRIRGAGLTPSVLQGLVHAGWQGLILKDTASPYRENSRGKEWIKYKPLGPTVDVLICSGRQGFGKREGSLASFPILVRGETGLTPIGHVGTGFDDQTLARINELLQARGRVSIEVRAQALVRSPRYPCGYALRFPSFQRFREDRDQPNTMAQVLQSYQESPSASREGDTYMRLSEDNSRSEKEKTTLSG